MGKLFISFYLLFFTFSMSGQIHDPVQWKTSVNKISDSEYELVIHAFIEPKWHLYSQEIPPDGPEPTTFSFEEKGFTLVGKTSEDTGHEIDDPVFQMRIKYFEDKADFRQLIKLQEGNLKQIVGEVTYMVCDDSKCLPPETKDLLFVLSPSAKLSKEHISDNDTKTPVKEEIKQAPSSSEGKRGLLSIFIIAFLSGFAALLTPCVFPMIPLTVSFFTKQSKNKYVGIRNAILYSVSIICIYVLLGSLVTAIFGADSLNALSTNVWFNVVFFLLLVVFAASFLGAFEIVLPSSWANKVDSQSNKGGIIGILFMALALAIVSFSCTGPIVGTLLVEAASKGGIAPIIGMLGFSSALALPFGLFATFPGWLNSLPKSGGWLNTVKVVLGFLELALAFKFLSNADLVLQLHWLEREVFLAIWIAIFGALTLYLFGKIQLPHDSPASNISVGRLGLGLLTLSFTVYMIPGLWGAPLNLISAFPPPIDYSESPYGVGFTKIGSGTNTAMIHDNLPEGSHLLAPHDILSFNDYDKGLAYAKKVKKPIMLDFTGWACVNCRKMEQNVWPDARILDILKSKVVLISLYVDDKRPLDEDEVIESKLRPGKKLKYIGQKWSEFQTIRHKANTQPFYVLTDLNGNNLVNPVAYTPNADKYYRWLKNGISKFKN